MNKEEIKKALDESGLDKKITFLGVKESLVYHGVLEDTKDIYANFLSSDKEIDKIKEFLKNGTQRAASHNDLIINDTIGYSVMGTDFSEATTLLNKLKVLTLEECIDEIKGTNEDNRYDWIIEKIRKYYTNKLSLSLRTSNKYIEILSSLE